MAENYTLSPREINCLERERRRLQEELEATYEYQIEQIALEFGKTSRTIADIFNLQYSVERCIRKHDYRLISELDAMKDIARVLKEVEPTRPK